MSLQAPSNLPDLVRATFARALAAGDVHFFPTSVTVLSINLFPFQLRFSPSLANKPKGPPKHDKTPFNPFASPSPALTIARLPHHNLVLNKFAIVPEHFILSTVDFKPQTHLLEADDLEATHACIRSYTSETGGLYAFFNSGPHSGASQPHRHVQLLPVARMRDGLEGDAAARWEVLADQITDDDTNSPGGRLPFPIFKERISAGDVSGADLRATYLRLYRRACESMNVAHVGTGVDGYLAGEAALSYNMAMTRSCMVVCPRVAEGADVVLAGTDETIGQLAVNGTVLAGTALVKSQAEWDALKEDPKQVARILRRIGPSVP